MLDESIKRGAVTHTGTAINTVHSKSITFGTAFTDSDYSVIVSNTGAITSGLSISISAKSASGFTFQYISTASSIQSPNFDWIAIKN